MMLRGSLLLLLLFSAHAYAQQKPDSNDWLLGDPADAGFEVTELEKLAADIEAGETNTHAVLVEHDGALVFERYFSGTDEKFSRPLGKRTMTRDSLHDLRSATKSVTSAVLGICLAEDFNAAVQRPIKDCLPELKLRATHRKITLHHVLTMTTGLKWNEMELTYRNPKNDAIQLYSVPNPSKALFSKPVEYEPGSTWYYNGGCTYVLADVVLQRTGKTIDEYAKEKLFKPLGITKFEWHGSSAWTSTKASAAAGLRLTARDLAKIGSVYLHGGKWRGKQIVPKGLGRAFHNASRQRMRQIQR